MSDKNRQDDNVEGSSTSNLLKKILGNAATTSVQFKQNDAGVQTKKCPNCSAARPAETDLKFCDYCGYQFY